MDFITYFIIYCELIKSIILCQPLDTQSCVLIFFTIIEDSISYVPGFLKGASSMEECLPYKKEVGGSIPPCPNDIIIPVKNNYISKKKIRDK